MCVSVGEMSKVLHIALYTYNNPHHCSLSVHISSVTSQSLTQPGSSSLQVPCLTQMPKVPRRSFWVSGHSVSLPFAGPCELWLVEPWRQLSKVLYMNFEFWTPAASSIHMLSPKQKATQEVNHQQVWTGPARCAVSSVWGRPARLRVFHLSLWLC